MQRFTELQVWRKSHQLVLSIYQTSKRFPDDERYGVTAQLRRAAVSVPTNIAEGSKRRSNLDYARFLNMSEASLAETEYLLMLARDLDYLDKPDATEMLRAADEVARMLSSLRTKVEQSARQTNS